MIPGIEAASPLPVLEASQLNEAQFNVWVDDSQPCLIKNAVRHWPALDRWKRKDYWLSICDNFPISVYPHQNHNDHTFMRREDMQFYDAIERLFHGWDRIFSMPSERITANNHFHKVLADIPGFVFLPDPPPPRVYDRSRMFMYRGASTAWHYHDIDETLMCQVQGTKQVALLSPRIPKARLVTDFLQQEQHLKGEILDKNLDLRPIVVDVEEGDALYIPPYWLHSVVPVGDDVGFTVAFCWASPWHKMGDLSSFFVRKLYRQALWPLKPISAAMPFIACRACTAHVIRKLRK